MPKERSKGEDRSIFGATKGLIQNRLSPFASRSREKIKSLPKTGNQLRLKPGIK